MKKDKTKTKVRIFVPREFEYTEKELKDHMKKKLRTALRTVLVYEDAEDGSVYDEILHVLARDFCLALCKRDGVAVQDKEENMVEAPLEGDIESDMTIFLTDILSDDIRRFIKKEIEYIKNLSLVNYYRIKAGCDRLGVDEMTAKAALAYCLKIGELSDMVYYYNSFFLFAETIDNIPDKSELFQ